MEVSDLESLNSDSLLQILYLIRPNEYIQLSGSSVKLRNFILNHKYVLFKYWSNSNLTPNELQKYVPNLTLRQLQFVGDYFRPNDESINDYVLDELIANALKIGDTDYLRHLPKDPSVRQAAIVYVLSPKSIDVIGIGIELLTTTYSATGIRALAGFRDTPYSTIIDYISKTNYIPPDIAKYIDGKWDPNTSNDIGILYHFDVMSREISLANRLSNKYMETMMKLSRYDSKKYPSYDPLDDLCSGNYLELLHKVNTWDRNITVDKFEANLWYTSWAGNTSTNIGELNEYYVDIASQIVGQAALHIHPSIIDRYLACRGYKLSDNADNYYLLLQRWCFPTKTLDEVKQIKYVGMKLVYNLSCYYEPAVIIDNWRGDINILLDRSLQQNLADERIRLLIHMYRFDDIHAASALILLYKYNRLHLDDSINGGGTLFRFLHSIFHDNPIQIDYTSTNHLYMILNHTYLTVDEKLYILSWSKSLQDSLLDGLSGISYDNHWCVAGNILNMYGSPEAVSACLKVFNMQYTPVQSLLHIDETLDALRQGNAHEFLFPLGLLWKETTYFRKTNSYMNDLLELVKDSSVRSNYLLGQARRYYEFATQVSVGSIIKSQCCAGPYGYSEENPLNRVI